MTPRHVRIGLGIVTHRRPDGLVRLIKSFATLQIPAGADCVILIAENDDVQTIDAIVEGLREAVPFEIKHALEKERGIPFARNRVLDMAIEDGCDFLTFIDDDQVVDDDWLQALYAYTVDRNLDLCGGPQIFMADPDLKMTWENDLILRYQIKQINDFNRVRASRAQGSDAGDIDIYTNNWMLRMSRQQELGTRFDEDYRFTGSEDTKFYIEFVAAGGATGWCSDARTYETWPADRLTFRYLYRRIRDQHATNLMLSGRAPSLFKALRRLIRSYIVVLGIVLRMPFKGLHTLPFAARAIARGVGAVRAARQKKSNHYQPD